MINNVRKWLVAIALVVLLPGLAKADRISLKITGGLSYGLFGDVNAATRGIFNLYKDDIVALGGSYIERLKPVHFGPAYSVDLIYNLDAEFSIALGTGAFRAKNTSGLTLVPLDALETSGSVFHEVMAIPVRLSLIDTRRINDRVSACFEAGADAYFAKFREIFMPPDGAIGDQQKANGIGWGLHYAVGLEVKLAPHFAFVVEGRGQYAQIRRLHGTIDSLDTSAPLQESGALYDFDLMGGPDGLTPYPMILVQETVPSGDLFSNVRRARVNFSGFSLQAGFKIHL